MDERYSLFPWMVRLAPSSSNGLTKPSAADTFQIRSIATQRFVRRLGLLAVDDMRKIERALAIVLRLS